MLLIGSRALDYWHPQPGRVKQNADWDVICTPEDYEKISGQRAIRDALSWKWNEYEFHNSERMGNAMVLFAYETPDTIEGPYGLVLNICSSRGLAVIKRSHLHREIKFAQHIRDYQLLDRNFNSEDLDMVDIRKGFTVAEFSDRTPSLNMSVEEFFDDYVKKHFNHDDLHKIVAHGEVPMYTRMQRDPKIVKCHRSLWNKFTHEEKVQCVQEECYVIALERILIPWKLKGKNFPYRMAFATALERVCTTLCGGFFRDFAIDNWAEASQFNPDKFDKFFKSKLWHERTTENLA